jgi:hypothetical protein
VFVYASTNKLFNLGHISRTATFSNTHTHLTYRKQDQEQHQCHQSIPPPLSLSSLLQNSASSTLWHPPIRSKVRKTMPLNWYVPSPSICTFFSLFSGRTAQRLEEAPPGLQGYPQRPEWLFVDLHQVFRRSSLRHRGLGNADEKIVPEMGNVRTHWSRRRSPCPVPSPLLSLSRLPLSLLPGRWKPLLRLSDRSRVPTREQKK